MSEPEPSRAPAGSEPEPSRAPEAPVRQKSWVILACIPDVVGEKKLPPGTHIALEFEDPPRTTIPTVARSIAPDPKDPHSFPYVVDVNPSGHFLLYTTHGGLFKSVYYLCDAHTGVATRLPDSTEPRIFPRRSIGLIEDPHRRGHYMVAQLHPTSSKHHETLVYHYTGASAWAVKELASSPHHQPWGSHGGVVAHDGKLWWVDLPYGLLTCDPFVDRPDLRYVALPEGCVMADANHPRSRADLDKHRCVKVSEGKLRYVEIHGLPGEQRVSMWTLANPERPDGEEWEHEYDVLLEDIWADESYMAAGLPPNKVPAIALIHPKNHGVIYFFHGSRLFAMDMRATERRVLECENCLMDYAMLDEFHNARFVHAWELPPTLLRLDISSAEMKRPDEEELSLVDLMTGSDEEELSSLMMSQVMGSDQGEFSLENLVRVLCDMPASAEGSESSPRPSVDASDQDKEP